MRFRPFFAHFHQSMLWAFVFVLLLPFQVLSLHNKKIKTRRPSLSSMNFPDLVLDRRSSFNRAYRTDIVSDTDIFVENRRKTLRPNADTNSLKRRQSENSLGYSGVVKRQKGDPRFNTLDVRKQASRRPRKNKINMGINLRNALDVISLRKNRGYVRRKSKKASGKSLDGGTGKYKRNMHRQTVRQKKQKDPTARTMNLGKYLNKVFKKPKTVQKRRKFDRVNSKRTLQKESYPQKSNNLKAKSVRRKDVTQNQREPFSIPVSKQRVSNYIRNTDYGDSTTPGLSLGNAFVPWDGFENIGLPVTPSISNGMFPQGGTSKEPVSTYRGIEIRYPQNHLYDLPGKDKTSFDNRGDSQHYNLFDRIDITDEPIASQKFNSNAQNADFGQNTVTPSDIMEPGFSVTTPQMKKSRHTATPYVKNKSQLEDSSRFKSPNHLVGRGFNTITTNHRTRSNTDMQLPASNVKYDHRIIQHPMNKNDKHKLPVHEYTSNVLYEEQGNLLSHPYGEKPRKPYIQRKQQSMTFQYNTKHNQNVLTPSRKASTQNTFSPVDNKRMVKPNHYNNYKYSGNKQKNRFSMKQSAKSSFKKTSFRNKETNPSQWTNINTLYEDSKKSAPIHKVNTHSTSQMDGNDMRSISTIMKNKKENMPPIIIPTTTGKPLTETPLIENRTDFSHFSTLRPKTKSFQQQKNDSYILLSGRKGNQSSLIMKSLVLDDNHHLTKKLAPYIEGRVETSSITTSVASSSTTNPPRTSGVHQVSTSSPKIDTAASDSADRKQKIPHKDNFTKENNDSETIVELSMNETLTTGLINTTLGRTTTIPSSSPTISENQSIIKPTYDQLNGTVAKNDKVLAKNTSDISIIDQPEKIISENVTDGKIIEQDLKDMNVTNALATQGTTSYSNTSGQRTDTIIQAGYNKDASNDQDIYNGSNVRFISTLSTVEVTFPSTVNPKIMTTTQYPKDNQVMHLAKGHNSSIFFKDTTSGIWSPTSQTQSPRTDPPKHGPPQNEALKRHEIPNVEWLSKSANKNQINTENQFVSPNVENLKLVEKSGRNIWQDKPKLPLPSIDNKIPVEKIPCNDTFNKHEMVTIAFGILQLLLQNVKLQKSLQHKEKFDHPSPKRKYLLIPLSMAEEKGLNDIIPRVVSGVQDPAIVDYYTPSRIDERNLLYSKAMSNLKKKKDMLEHSMHQNSRHTQYANEAGLRRSQNLLKLMKRKNKHFSVRNDNSIAPKSEIYFPNRV